MPISQFKNNVMLVWLIVFSQQALAEIPCVNLKSSCASAISSITESSEQARNAYYLKSGCISIKQFIQRIKSGKVLLPELAAAVVYGEIDKEISSALLAVIIDEIPDAKEILDRSIKAVYLASNVVGRDISKEEPQQGDVNVAIFRMYKELTHKKGLRFIYNDLISQLEERGRDDLANELRVQLRRMKALAKSIREQNGNPSDFLNAYNNLLKFRAYAAAAGSAMYESDLNDIRSLENFTHQWVLPVQQGTNLLGAAAVTVITANPKAGLYYYVANDVVLEYEKVRTGFSPPPKANDLLWKVGVEYPLVLMGNYGVKPRISRPRSIPKNAPLASSVADDIAKPILDTSKPVVRSILDGGEYFQMGSRTFMSWVKAENQVAQGWKIHISASRESAYEVAEHVLPILRNNGVPHKVVQTGDTMLKMTGTQQGKFITIYPQSNAEALKITRILNQTLKGRGLTGPRVPGELALGDSGLLYTRYGQFGRRAMVKPDGSIAPDIRGKVAPDWVDLSIWRNL